MADTRTKPKARPSARTAEAERRFDPPASKPEARTGRFAGGASEANELVRGMGLKPLKGRMGPRWVY